MLGGPALAGALTLAVRRGSGAPTPAAAGPSPLAVPARVLRTAPPAPHEVRAERAQALLDWRDAPPGRTRA